ncbi:MAG: SWIM zinc finger family protein [Chroococcidiopsis sp.]
MTTNQSFQASREWWSQRWLDLLDSYRFKKRLERGRNYARQGNILSIKFEESQVLARVQGTDPEPYKVSLFLDKFDDEQWGYVVETMSQKAIYAAKLLAGEMPQNIEEVFTTNGLSLFPFTLSEVKSRCSCPDKANPCKHVAAVYYQLGDRFSEDPFVLFQLRGRTKDEVLTSLREFRSKGDKGEVKIQNSKFPDSPRAGFEPRFVDRSRESSAKSAPTTPDSRLPTPSFWQYNEPLDPSLVVIAPSLSGETILDVLGEIPVAELETDEADRGDATASGMVQQYFTNLYQQASQQAAIAAMSTG